jgi:hypothetical protein
MNERIRESMNYVKSIYLYEIDESTFTVLNEEREWWIAKATTTHLTERGDNEVELVVLVQGYNVSVIPPDIASSFAQWFSQHWTGEQQFT